VAVYDYYVLQSSHLENLSNKFNYELSLLESKLKQDSLSKPERRQIKEKIKQLKVQFKKQLQPMERNGTTVLVNGQALDFMIWVRKELPQAYDARDWYIEDVRSIGQFKLPEELNMDSSPRALLPGWVTIEVEFILETPWYSKDDQWLHVLDNPVRKDRVFGAPYMAAASWKGLLRWACRMKQGLFKHLEDHEMSLNGWRDDAWIVHLFGNERGTNQNSTEGALVFYPTWFSKIDFELINPHDRKNRAGTGPILYEVVPANVPGTLRLLYAPRPVLENGVKPEDALANLLDAVELLLTRYGFAAKRTSGWGRAKINKWCGINYRGQKLEKGHVQELKDQIGELLSEAGLLEGGENQ